MVRQHPRVRVPLRIYGEEPPETVKVVSVAIDSNDTRSSAESYIGPIYFRKP